MVFFTRKNIFEAIISKSLDMGYYDQENYVIKGN